MNKNCLSGMACPTCKADGPFRINTSCVALWTDSGIEETTEHEFGDADFATCESCGWTGTVDETRHAIRSWRTEFGAEWDVPAIIANNPELDDDSWSNDSCPSFSMKGPEEIPVVRLWVEHPNPDKREMGAPYRYAVTVRKFDEGIDEEWVGDDPERALEVLRQATTAWRTRPEATLPPAESEPEAPLS